MDETAPESGQTPPEVDIPKGEALANGSSVQVLPSQQVEKDIKDQRFQQAVKDAEAIGIGEQRMRMLVQTVRGKTPMERGAYIANTAKELGVQPNDVLRAARIYQKEKVRLVENGDLLHYHQTSFDRFDGAAGKGGLMSYNMREVVDGEQADKGVRPDVVQMTRDQYNADGNLVRRGLVNSLELGAAASDVVLVFDSSIMDSPEYDLLEPFPNLPVAPCDKLRAVLVKSEEYVPRAMAILEKHKLNGEVVTRDNWITSVYQVKER